MRLPRVSPRAFLRLAQGTLVLVVFNIVSGAAVRLTDSGLGCPDWPDCSKRSLTPALSFHPDVEFANRMVVVVLTVVVAVTALAAWQRKPRRGDLLWISVGLVAGVVGEAVLGAIVVYSKLNPYAVMTHFMVGIALLSVATWLALRAGRAPSSGPLRVTPVTKWAALVMLGLLALAVVAGTATTGAGPHAGGMDAVRLPVPLADMARVHSSIVLATVAVMLIVLYRLARSAAPDGVRQKGEVLLAAMVGQGVIGYTQYFTHLPALLVAMHVLGATVVWCSALWFFDGLFDPVPDIAGHDAGDDNASLARPSHEAVRTR